ncbi:MAG: electron transfer flavoprotein subunit alpha/FixB family protein [Chloroflexi bacterium]|nr:electron transfer flavoprotein subunit alpha/FixB family protein [Chloroflexota bacterium]
MQEYRGVWVLAEHREGELRRVTFELLGKGRELADALGVALAAILLGSGVGEMSRKLIAYGADKVFLADHPELEHYRTDTYARVVAKEVLDRKPEIFIVGATYLGRDLAPRVAQRLNTGLTADCTGLDIDREQRLLVQTRPAFGGNLIATIVTPEHRPQIATVRPRVMKPLAPDPAREGEVIAIPVRLEDKDLRVRVLARVKEARDSVNLEEAELIVAGGSGVGAPERFKVLEDLARELGAELGASRDVVDAGWISSTHQVGQTGKTVSPKLYLACGISGAVQHVAGIRGSEVIVAINSNPEAAIFQVAHYAVVGDLHQIVPALTEKLRQARSHG